MQSVEATQASGVEPGWDCKAAAVTASGPSAAVGIKRDVCDKPQNLVGGEAKRHGPHNARHYANIVELRHRAIDAEPIRRSRRVSRSITCTPHQGSESVSASAVERQALEALVARLGQADEGVLAVKGEPAHEAGAEGERVKLGVIGRGPRSIQPNSPVPELSSQSLPRWRRGECGIDSPRIDDLACLHVDHDAAVGAAVAPAVDGVGLLTAVT